MCGFFVMSKTKRKKDEELVLEHLGSLIMVKGQEGCLGYLMDFKEKGVWDANHGKLDVSPEHAAIHNKELTKALLVGLDENCQLGEWGTFYYKEPPLKASATVELKGDKITAEANLPKESGKPCIKTFTGEVVSDDLAFSFRGKVTWVTFMRNNKTFRGKKPKVDNLFHFQRVG